MQGKRAGWIAVLLGLSACSNTEPKDPAAEGGRRLMTGEQVACALTGAGTVYCWGLNTAFWEYGASPATVPGKSSPSAPPTVPALSSLGRGVGTHFCGIMANKDGVCWARNDFGQLGSGIVGSVGQPPNTVTGATHWTDISVSRLTTCGLSDTGAGYCWGSNQRGEIGSTSVAISAKTPAPTAVDGGRTFKAMAAGWLHACGLTPAGAAYCWGSNASGQLGAGLGDTSNVLTPIAVTGGLTFTQLSSGSRYSCGLTTDGTAYCWGENATGQLGDGTRVARIAPTLVAGGLKFVELVTSSGFGTGAYAVLPPSPQGGVGHTCGLTSDGRAYCWGWNGNGELGDGTNTDRLAPVQVTGGLTFNTIAVGGAYTCAMKGDNVWCWGSNQNGQLGRGDLLPSTSPQRVGSPF